MARPRLPVTMTSPGTPLIRSPCTMRFASGIGVQTMPSGLCDTALGCVLSVSTNRSVPDVPQTRCAPMFDPVDRPVPYDAQTWPAEVAYALADPGSAHTLRTGWLPHVYGFQIEF